MPRKARELGVWRDGVLIASLEQIKWPRIRLRYTEEALARFPGNSPLVSCSLPLQARPLDALAFCRGLLPEGQALQALAGRAGVAENDTFSLLARYGRDVAGALVISATPPDPSGFGAEAFTPATLGEAVDELDEHPLGVHDDSELSLAGLQDKLLLVALAGGEWGRPLHGRPSTHILKVDDRRRPGLVAAEADCLRLAAAIGLTSIGIALKRIGETQCLIVSRFDRTGSGDHVRRVHQEDLCQALGIDPAGQRGRAKYERAGGPSFAAAARLLETYAVDPAGELDRLVATMTFTIAIGNADAHGKNLALLHPDGEHVTLAPLYDTVPTVLWPKLRTEAAMWIGARTDLGVVTLDDVVAEAARWPHPAARARAVAEQTCELLRGALADEAIAPDSPVARLVAERLERLLGH